MKLKFWKFKNVKLFLLIFITIALFFFVCVEEILKIIQFLSVRMIDRVPVKSISMFIDWLCKRILLKSYEYLFWVFLVLPKIARIKSSVQIGTVSSQVGNVGWKVVMIFSVTTTPTLFSYTFIRNDIQLHSVPHKLFNGTPSSVIIFASLFEWTSMLSRIQTEWVVFSGWKTS